MKFNNRRVIHLVIALCFIFLFVGFEQGAIANSDFPNRPVTLVLPFGPGSAADLYGRTFARVAEKYFGQPVIVDNREGAGGAAGMLELVNRNSDGYSFGYNSVNAATNIASGQAYGLTRDDLIGLALLCSDQSTFSVHPNGRFQSMTEALEFAKLNPGEVTVAGGVLLSGAHLITLIVEKYADVDLNYIPYDSGGQALVALLGENVDLFSASSGFILSSYQAGEVNVIAQSYDERQQLFSEVPTLAEVGMGLEQMSEPYTAWKALFIHSETPEEILKIYDEVIEKTVNDPEWIEFVENHNQIINFMPRGKFADHYLKQIDEFESLIKELR